MTMDCSAARSHMLDLVEDNLPESLHSSVSEHVTACQECTRIREEFAALERVFEERKTHSPDPFARTRILQHIENAFGHGSARPSGRWISALRPAGIVMAMACGILLGIYQARQPSPGAAAAAQDREKIESLRNDMFITHFADEDNLMALTR